MALEQAQYTTRSVARLVKSYLILLNVAGRCQLLLVVAVTHYSLRKGRGKSKTQVHDIVDFRVRALMRAALASTDQSVSSGGSSLPKENVQKPAKHMWGNQRPRKCGFDRSCFSTHIVTRRVRE